MNLDAQLDDARLAVICSELATAKAAPAPALRPLRSFTVVKRVVRDPVTKRIDHVVEEHVEHESRAWATSLKALWRTKDPRAVRKSVEPGRVTACWAGKTYLVGDPVPLVKSARPATDLPPLSLEEQADTFGIQSLTKAEQLELKAARRPS